MNKIIISAYSFYPDQKSSEAIVNKNWIQILSTKTDFSIYVLSAFNNYISKHGKLKRCKKLMLYSFITKQTSKNKGFLKLLYRVFNKLYKTFFSTERSLQSSLWLKKQARTLLDQDISQAVVWARILPIISLEPLLRAYKKKSFPFIINVNDPISNSFDKSTNFNEEELIFLKTKDIAQAWTFPSSMLADKMARVYGLDRNRCFVIPHAMIKADRIYKRDVKKEVIDILYTGTFYKSAFTDEFKRNLKSFFQLELSKYVTFTFVLSQYDDTSLQWLKESIPNIKLKFKIKREEVLGLMKKSDCMLVVDSLFHKELLKGKLIEAMSYGVPILSVTYRNSVTDNVVKEYGGISAYQDIENDIVEKVIFLTKNLKKAEYLNAFYKKRKNIIDKISEESILEKSMAVSQFAWNRFNNTNNFENLNILEHAQWP